MDPRDRIEPKISGETDHTGQRARHRFERSPTGDQSHDPGLWMHIALGIFIGLTAHSVLVLAYVKWEVHRAQQIFIQEMEKLKNYTNQR